MQTGTVKPETMFRGGPFVHTSPCANPKTQLIYIIVSLATPLYSNAKFKTLLSPIAIALRKVSNHRVSSMKLGWTI